MKKTNISSLYKIENLKRGDRQKKCMSLCKKNQNGGQTKMKKKTSHPCMKMKISKGETDKNQKQTKKDEKKHLIPLQN
tara:strand:+ start:243 stop:476 length:234 start_codon:yes stop_codon:yes gene_type:complete